MHSSRARARLGLRRRRRGAAASAPKPERGVSLTSEMFSRRSRAETRLLPPTRRVAAERPRRTPTGERACGARFSFPAFLESRSNPNPNRIARFSKDRATRALPNARPATEASAISAWSAAAPRRRRGRPPATRGVPDRALRKPHLQSASTSRALPIARRGRRRKSLENPSRSTGVTGRRRRVMARRSSFRRRFQVRRRRGSASASASSSGSSRVARGETRGAQKASLRQRRRAAGAFLAFLRRLEARGSRGDPSSS